MIVSRLYFQLDSLKNIDPVAALWPAGLILKQAAVAIVPVDTGHLRDSITVEELPPSEQGIMVYAGAGEYEVNYAGFVEYGTSNPNYPIQPYMRPSIDENLDAMADAVSKNIHEQVRLLVK
jgi:hypothetical protein